MHQKLRIMIISSLNRGYMSVPILNTPPNADGYSLDIHSDGVGICNSSDQFQSNN
jgi:hypothetical protein